MCTKFHQNHPSHQNSQAYQSAYLLPRSTLRHWVREDLHLQYFKSTNEDHVYEVSYKSPSMLNSLSVACFLETLPHPTLRCWGRASLALQYSSTSHLMRNLCTKFH
ncbi:hypothetical protein AVEN_70457-1 [Araneus ventricosus]|uniref:Uncharacterized protein n=1 Tax=Araneus ventricosus TaxID=182803 RepID=A0A4Y2SED5_ARAVE|nr:hypothetical protein AVEN_70457-1 [Araneus ventricosus]